MNKIYISNSAEDTFLLGEKLGRNLSCGSIVALYGGLGTGKTVFAKGIAAGLEIKDEVVSPTYTLLKEYKGKHTLYHFDLYRIDEPQELFHIGLYDYLGKDGVCIIEWADNAEKIPPCISVKIDGTGQDKRKITIEGFVD